MGTLKWGGAMRLDEYVAKHGRGTMRVLAEASGVSYLTIRNATQGMRIKLYDIALAISKATGGAVSVAELCEPPKKGRRRR